MSTKPKRWGDMLAEMPRLTKAQADAVKEIVDRHIGWLSGDYPKVDDAHYTIQCDLDSITNTGEAKP